MLKKNLKKNEFNFYNSETQEYYTGTIANFCKKYKTNRASINAVIKKDMIKTKDNWYVSTNSKYNLFYFFEVNNINFRTLIQKYNFKNVKEAKEVAYNYRTIFNVPSIFIAFLYSSALKNLYIKQQLLLQNTLN